VAASQGSLIPGALDRFPLGALAQMHRLSAHLDRVADQVRTPTLILHAREDDMSHPRNALRLRARLGGPVDLHLLDDCYHMIHVDQQRDLVGDMTADFFGAPPAARTVGRRAVEGADA
jgi:carboxylesterase